MKKQIIFMLVLTLTLLVTPGQGMSIAAPPGETASTALRDDGGTLAAPGAAPIAIYAGDPPSAPQNLKAAGVEASIVSTDTREVTVDIYQNMGSGNDGDLLTPEIMNASSHGGIEGVADPEWVATAGSMWVSTDHARELPGIVTVDGVNYSGKSARTWRFRDRYKSNYVSILFGDERQWNHTPYHDRMTVACYYTPGPLTNLSNAYYLDTIIIDGPQKDGKYIYAVLQKQQQGGIPLCIKAHGPGLGSDPIFIEANKTYWVNLHYDGPAGKIYVAVFDPDNGFAQVGIREAWTVQGSQVRSRVKFGRVDSHADYNTDDVNSYFSHILIDYTEAKFPLLPAVSGPALTLHGTPANQAIHLSWEVSSPPPPTSTWQIDYASQTGSAYLPVTGLISTTRAYTLTNLTNGVWYTVTLSAMQGSAAILTDTVRAMPTDRFIYLPLILRPR